MQQNEINNMFDMANVHDIRTAILFNLFPLFSIAAYQISTRNCDRIENVR